jgi:hypothetical protein
MKTAKTIQDVAELCADYQVNVLLADNNTVEFTFPETEEETNHKNERLEDFSHLGENDTSYFKRKARFAIRGLVESPRFWRLTTTADQIGSFCLGYKETKYGKIRARKKLNENLKIVFENMKYATKFFKDLKKTRQFKEEKVK